MKIYYPSVVMSVGVAIFLLAQITINLHVSELDWQAAISQ